MSHSNSRTASEGAWEYSPHGIIILVTISLWMRFSHNADISPTDKTVTINNCCHRLISSKQVTEIKRRISAILFILGCFTKWVFENFAKIYHIWYMLISVTKYEPNSANKHTVVMFITNWWMRLPLNKIFVRSIKSSEKN